MLKTDCEKSYPAPILSGSRLRAEPAQGQEKSSVLDLRRCGRQRLLLVSAIFVAQISNEWSVLMLCITSRPISCRLRTSMVSTGVSKIRSGRSSGPFPPSLRRSTTSSLRVSPSICAWPAAKGRRRPPSGHRWRLSIVFTNDVTVLTSICLGAETCVDQRSLCLQTKLFIPWHFAGEQRM